MLGILREHRNNVLVKIFFGLFILSFAGFFGLSAMGPSQRQGSPAEVNGVPINPAKFNYLLSNQMERFKSQFKEEIPKEFSRNMSQSVINTLINQMLIAENLKQFGVKTTEDELAEVIRSSPQFQREGQFDLDYYKNRFLPGYRLSTGSSYENDIQEELALQRFFGTFNDLIEPTTQELEQETQIQTVTFKYDVITIPVRDASKMDAESTASSEELQANAKTLANQILDAWKSDASIDELITTNKLTRKETPELNYRKIKFVFGGKGSTDNLKSIVSLTSDKPFVGEPLLEGNYYYIAKLVEKKTIDLDEDELKELKGKIKQAYLDQLNNSLQGAYVKSLRDAAQISVVD